MRSGAWVIAADANDELDAVTYAVLLGGAIVGGGGAAEI
jgi:hypothetical protein